MSEMNRGLQHLHRLLTQLSEVQDNLDRGPRQVKAAEQLVLKADAALAEKREALKQAKASADRRSLDLRTKEAKIADLQAKLNAASSNREYDIIRGQIEADTVANSVLEDEILEALELVDRMQVAVGEAELKVKQSKEDQERRAQQVTSAEAGLKTRCAELQGQIKEAEKILEGDTAEKYRRLVEAYAADALAALDGMICTNCFVAITAQSRVLLNSGKNVFCHCGRLLYVPEAK